MDEKLKIVGIEKIQFQSKDGENISGQRIHTLEKISAARGVGEAANNFFLSDARLNAISFTLAVGQVIQPVYSRFGKIVTIILVDSADDVIDLG